MGKKPKKIMSYIHVYLPKEEKEKVLSDQGKTTCRSLNEYARKRLTGKFINVYYRDKAYDEFIETGCQLKKRLDKMLSEHSFSEAEKNALADDVKTIKELLTKIYDHVRGNRVR